jgi:hypothetical protein
MVETPIDLKNLTLEFVRAELEFRRNKQSSIFAWCSTILVAITSGVIVLQIRQPPLELSDTQKELLSWAIIVLAAHAVSWLGHNAHLEDRAAGLFEAQVAERIWGTKKPSVGYRSALIMLGVGAMVAIWLPANPTNMTKKIVLWSVVVSGTLLSGWALYTQFERLKEKNKG